MEPAGVELLLIPISDFAPKAAVEADLSAPKGFVPVVDPKILVPEGLLTCAIAVFLEPGTSLSVSPPSCPLSNRRLVRGSSVETSSGFAPKLLKGVDLASEGTVSLLLPKIPILGVVMGLVEGVA
jgi:hypothetical protein